MPPFNSPKKACQGLHVKKGSYGFDLSSKGHVVWTPYDVDRGQISSFKQAKKIKQIKLKIVSKNTCVLSNCSQAFLNKLLRIELNDFNNWHILTLVKTDMTLIVSLSQAGPQLIVDNTTLSLHL